MKKAEYKDKPIVINILLKSFKNDPHINWLLEKSKNPNKLRILMDYIFEESLQRSKIYLNDDNTAVAIWNSEKQLQNSVGNLIRDLSFLFKIGIKATLRITKMGKIVHDQYPKNEKYCQLYFLGVIPEEQGKGLASELLNPIIENMSFSSIPIFLETANIRNVEIYKKKDFAIYNIIQKDGLILYLMRTLTPQNSY